MSIFKPRDVSAKPIEVLQLGANDDKTQALDRVEEERRKMLLSGSNPWMIPDAAQLDAAFCAVVYMNDRLAEIFYQEAKRLDRRGRNVLPPDIHRFAYELSNLAHVRLEFIRNGLATGDIRFTDTQRRSLNIENNMPSFPVYPAGYGYEQPYDQDPSRGVVTYRFVELLNQAAKELQGHANAFATSMEIWERDLPHPYNVVINTVRQAMLYPAMDRSKQADELLNCGAGRIDPAALSAAFYYAVRGYVLAGNGYIACFCPASLGEGWEPPR